MDVRPVRARGRAHKHGSGLRLASLPLIGLVVAVAILSSVLTLVVVRSAPDTASSTVPLRQLSPSTNPPHKDAGLGGLNGPADLQRNGLDEFPQPGEPPFQKPPLEDYSGLENRKTTKNLRIERPVSDSRFQKPDGELEDSKTADKLRPSPSSRPSPSTSSASQAPATGEVIVIHASKEFAPNKTGLPTVLVLSPVKNAWSHLGKFWKNMMKLDYPKNLMSVAFLEGDSDDHGAPSGVTTMGTLRKLALENGADYRRITLVQKSFGKQLRREARKSQSEQLSRRSVMARSRNYLVATALQDEMWVLWIDSDLESYPSNALRTLLGSGKEVVTPNAVMTPGGRSYDLNAWRSPPMLLPWGGLAVPPAADLSAASLRRLTSQSLIGACASSMRAHAAAGSGIPKSGSEWAKQPGMLALAKKLEDLLGIRGEAVDHDTADDKPEAKSGKLSADDKPEAMSGKLSGDDKPEAKSGKLSGDDKPEAKSGKLSGDDKPEAKSGKVSADDKPEAKSGKASTSKSIADSQQSDLGTPSRARTSRSRKLGEQDAAAAAADARNVDKASGLSGVEFRARDVWTQALAATDATVVAKALGSSLGLAQCLVGSALRVVGESSDSRSARGATSGVEVECRARWPLRERDKGSSAGAIRQSSNPDSAAERDFTSWAESGSKALQGWLTGWGDAADGPELLLEGYGHTGNLPLSKLRGNGSLEHVVELDGVGGAMLLVKADLHREGLMFPPAPYRRRIETEGLAILARDMGHRAWGMPNLEIIHA